MRGPVSTQKIVSEGHCENSGCCEKLLMLLKAFLHDLKLKLRVYFTKRYFICNIFLQPKQSQRQRYVYFGRHIL